MRYPLSSQQSISPEAVEAAVTVLRSGKFTMGAQVAQFEHDFAKWVGSKHAVMVNSGSSANLLAIEALVKPSPRIPIREGWGPGCEVLVPALAWSTTVMPLIQRGLVPVFVDIDEDTLAMDLNHAEYMYSHQCVGLMLIHVLGLAAPHLLALQGLCEQRRMTLIEDCCEAFGAFSYGQSVGTMGLMGTFSHFFSHQLTTMEGGTIVTDDDDIADDLRSMRAHGWTRERKDRVRWNAEGMPDPSFCFVTTGYNVRPLEVQGAMGVVQLAHAEQGLMERSQTAFEMVEVLKTGAPYLKVVGSQYAGDSLASLRSRKNRRHSWMNLPILVTDDAPFTRDQVVQRFNQAGIETRPIIAGNLLRHPVMPSMNVRRAREYPVADKVMRQGFMMGCHPDPGGVEALYDACRALKVAA